MSILHINLFRDRSLWKSIVLILLFNGIFFLWLLIKPGTPTLFIAVENIMLVISMLISIFYCFRALGNLWRRSTPHAESMPVLSPGQRWVPILLGSGLVSGLIGISICTYYAVVLNQPTPFPSLADVFFLLGYLLVLPGVLLLPTRPLSKVARSRVLADGLMIMTALVTFSWFFVLGPTLQAGQGTNLAKFIGAAYPFADLLLALCLLMLAFRNNDPMMHTVVFLLSISSAIIIVTDSAYDYLTLQGLYATGNLIDVGWSLGYMLLGVATWVLCRNGQQQAFPIQDVPDRTLSHAVSNDVPSLWRALIPYMPLPVIGLLVLYISVFGVKDNTLAAGVYIGGVALIGLVLVRQVLSLREAIQAHQEIQENNNALELANARLASLATTDVLTGLPNHRALQTLLEQEGERTNRSGHSLSLLFFDGDHFKQVNDIHGHAVGDIVLRELGERARSALRAGDTVGRFGGEEFLVLLPATDEQEAKVVAERVRAAVAVLPLAGDAVKGGVAVTVSIGVASYPSDGTTISEVREQADQAMYWAKRLGRNQVRTAAEAVRANQDAVLKATTAHALKRQELTPLDGRDHESQVRAEQLGLIYSLMGALDVREPGMSTHAHEVSDLVAGMARILQFDDQHALRTATAAFLHDIGKIALPDRLLQQSRQSLSSREWRLLQQHAELGATIVEASTWLSDLAPAIRHHHERWDGTGVPDGLAGSAIPLEARLIAMAEAYHAMISEHSYQAARSPAEALDEIERCVGSQFDPELLPTFRTVLAQWQVASIPFVNYAEQELFSPF